MQVVPGPAAAGAAPEGNELPRQQPAAIVEQLRQIAARVLDVEPVRLDPDRSLLALGVDSLAAAEMAGAIESDFAVRVSLVSLIEGASLADLAGEIASALAATKAAGATAGDSGEAEAAAAGGEAPGRYAVSRGQQALLLLDRLVPGGNPAYVMAGAARVLSGWDQERFAQALAAVVARHAALRTTFGAAGESFEREVHAAAPWQLEERDAAGWSEAALAAGMAEVAHRPFDLERGPLLRVAVFKGAAGERLLVLAVHHLVADFASIGVVLAELGALYSRRRGSEGWPGPAPAAGSYGAYVRAQEAALAGPEGARLRSYWHRNLGGPDGKGGALPVLSLPADRPRPPVPSFQGGTRRLRLPPEVCESLQSLGSAAGSTRFMTLLAGFVALLHRHGGQPEVLVGTPASGRGRAERAGLVGYLVNPVVVRGDAAGEPTFMELLGRVRESALGAFAHQEYPLARLAEELAGERDAGRSALFQAMFVLYRERSPGERGLAALALGEAGVRFALGGLALESAALPRRSAQFDLMLLMADLDAGLAGALQYNSDLFDGATIERLAGHLCTLLAAVALPVAPGGGAVAGGMGGAGAHQRLGELPLLTAGERQQLLEWNATAAVYAAPVCLHELIAAQARRTPLAVAVEAEAGEAAWQGGGVWESLTYRELDARAERLAQRLRRLGVGPETVVAICAERSLALMVGLLGILKAGGAYLPLDPGYPPERLDYMLRDSGAPVLLAQERLRAAVVARLQAPPGGTVWLDASPATPGHETPGDERKAANAGAGTGADTADGLAYVIYTSGSTGRPKGTMNTHRGIVNRLLWMQNQYRLGASDRVLQKTPASFDVSVWELFWPLLAGARLVMAAPGGHRDSAYLLRILGERQITTLHFVPAMLAAFLEHVAALSGPRPPALRSLRRVMASGEALPWSLQQRCHALLGAPLYNLYGPTEAAVDVTHWACVPADVPAAAAPPAAAASAQNLAAPPAVSVVPIGRPVANTRIHLLDRAAREAPIGLPAELYIGGVQLARGYLGRPDLTAERFVADPLAGVAGPAGSRLYRTGDVARYRADGAIEYLGRTDDQVKIRGFRIELGEIEAALLRHPEVREAAVVVRGTDAAPGAPLPGRGAPDDRWLVAYLVLAADAANQGTGERIERLRLSLRESLPEQMLPAAFVVLPALPLTASGKVDRRALPAPERAGGGTAGSARRSVPRTPTERVLARLWADVLAAAPATGEGGGPRIAGEDSFFELGGHSLLATRLTSRIWQAFGVELPLHRLFEHPTLAAMARAIDEGAAMPRAAGSGGAAVPIVAGAPTEPAAALPLSFAQERIWFVEQLHPGTIAYNVPGALRLTGELGVRGHAALAASLNEIVRRHDVLRSVYSRAAGSDHPGQVILPFAAAPLALVDLSGLGAAAVAAGDGLAAALGRRPFDLTTGPLLRTALLRLGPAEHVLVVVLHHIVADGWSVAIFQRELAALYAALSSHPAAAVLPDLPLQYADYARWLRSWLAGEVLAGHLAYWRQALAGAPAQLSLPADRPRPAERNGRGGRTRVWLPAAQVVGLQTAARRHGATLFMVLLAAFDVLLARLSRQDDVVVGSPVANRGRVEVEALIGCFVNTLALRVDLAGRPTFAALLAQVRQRCLEAYAHQDMPFEKLVEALAPQRDLGATPIFQVMLVLQSAWGAEGVAASPAAPLPAPATATPAAQSGSQPGLAMELAEIEIGVAKFDLTLEAVESGAGVRLTLDHSADLFDAATAKRLAGHYLNLLAALAGGAAVAADAAPGGTVAAVGEPAAWQSSIAGLPWLSAAERQQLREWNATAAAYDGGDRCLHELVEEQVRRTPQAVAVVADATGPTGHGGGPQSLTYAALSSAASRLARHLRGRGVGPETVVAISAERSLSLVVGILAILKAGGAYLPLDSDYPRERLLYMLDDAGARILLTHGEPTARLAAGNGDARRIETLRIDAPGAPWRRRSGKDLPRGAGGAAPENLAYVIYTSGSTGRPKGAMNTHRAIVNQLLWRQQRFGLAADDRMLQKTPASFDVSVWEMFSPLLVGGRVVMARPGGHRDAPYLWQVLAAQEITKIHFVPAMLAMFLEEAAAGRSLPPLPALRRVLVGGEALSPELRQRCREVLSAPLHNLYGPTETAVDVTFWACAPPGAPAGAAGAAAADPPASRRLTVPPAVSVVPIGRPLANTRIHLLDRDGREAPIGVPADLFIGGVQVGRGYLGRPQLTAERFVPDPFGEPGSRLYATGDVARYLLDGAIDYLGRADGQVKIRGFRIELGEIETALRRHPAVREAMVNVVEGPAPGAGAAVRRLVAYVVAADPSQAQLGAALRQALADQLPEHMVPAAFVALPGLPLLPSGKVDRRALPAPDWHGGAGGGERTAPRSPLERALAALWAEVLGFAPAADAASDRDNDPATPAIAIEDSFFDLGGHSLLATRLLSRVRLTFGVELSLRRLFEAPRLGAMAREIGALGAAVGPPPLSRRPASTEAPLSYAQERLWLVAQLTPGSTAYNLSGVLRLSGPFDARDLAALVWSLNQIVRRHEVLRSAYPVTRGGVPVQVAAPFVSFDLPLVDVSAGVAAAAAAARVAAALGSRPFDLGRGPLLRMALVRLGPQEHRLILVLHHIVADGWAVGVFLRELAALHRALADGGESRLPELAVQYADYAHWQRSWLQGEALHRLLVYWRQVLGGAPAQLALATDRPRPAVARFRGAVVAESLQAGLTEELRRGARQRGTTLFMVLLAAFDVLLARLSGQEDIVVGSPIANRERLEIEGLVGCFVNTLVLRTDLAGRPSFAELLARARQVCLGAYAHQDMPFEKLVEALAPRRDLGSTPLFQVMLVLQNTWTVAAAATAAATLSGGPFPVTDSALPAELRAGLAMELVGIEIGIAKFDLTLQAAETRGGLSLSFEYSSDLFDAATVKRLAGSFQALLAALAGGAWDDELPALPCLSAAQRQQLLLEWNATAAPYGGEDRLLHEQFSRQAARTPDAVAVAAGLGADAVRLSYAELDRQASGLARRLRAQGVGPEVLVGLCAERTVGLVVGILGILKAGGAYLPLDPAHPEARLRYLLADAGAPVVVAEEALLDRLPAGSHRVVLLAPDAGADGEPRPAVLPENPAYVIYTSGSTGRPKGVVVSHRNVSRLFAVTAPLFGFGPSDVWTLFHSFAFDFSVWELWGALLHGGRVVVVPYWVSRSPEAFRELLVRQGVTRLSQTPSAFHQLSRVAGEGELAVRSVVLGGEALEPRSLLPWLEREGETARLVNMYGITETTVHVTYRELFAAEVDRLPGSVIGRPLGDLATYVLDSRGELSPPGVVGELYVGGEGLARGYLGRPALTAERFVPHPFAAAGGARLYRTGDLGRFLASGELEYLGRMDTQVKIRGFRIELGEVEAALAAHPDVQAAAVLVREDRPGDRRLVAYVVPRHGAPDANGAAGAGAASGAAAGLDAATLRRHLTQRLPEPMLPAAWVTLAALPLTANGKVDRSALAQIAPETRRTDGELLAPRTPAEELLAGIWAQVLGRERVGVGENFFELGGHSLLAVRMVAELRHRAGVELPLARLFALPRLEDLAREVEALARGAGSPLAPIRRLPPETRDLPLSFAQERLWFLDRLDPGRATYNLAGNLHFAGRLDTGALATGLAEIRRRHRVLRTRFAELPGGGVAARLAPDAGDPAVAAPALPLIDLGGLPRRRRAAVAAELAAAEARRPFDLALDPLAQTSAGRPEPPAGLLRAFVVRLARGGGEVGEREEARAGEAAHRLSLTLHHIVADGWSIEVLVRELAVLYHAAVERRPPAPGALPELPIQYADFAAWQREWLRGDTLERELAYWRSQLAGPSGAPPPLDLAGDRPRPATASGRGGRRFTPVPRHLAGALAELAQRQGATLFMALLAAFDTLLLRHTGQSDVTVGTPVANRSRPEVQNLVGLFVNTLVLRLDLAGDPSFAELLGRARQVALAAYDHQDVPFDKLVSELAPRRGTAETPFFQVVLALQGALPALSLPGLAVRLADPGSDTAKFDLSLAFSRLEGGGLEGVWIYRTDLFDPATIERLGGQLQTLLAELAGTAAGVERRLSELPLLDAAARHQLLYEWSLSIWDEGGEDLLHAPFERQAAARPAAIALVDWDAAGTGEERTLTYGELAAWVAPLTRRLVARGVGPEQVVGICAEPSFALVAGLLAILQAGGAYLPLDPALPPERLAQLLADSAADVVLAAPEVAGRLPATLRPLLLAAAPLDRDAEAPARLRRAPVPDNAAYVLYTSGSTGQPKGVVVPHRAVVNRLRFQAAADLAAGARVLQRTRLSFDVSIVEIFAPLWTGGAVVLTRAERQQDVSYLARLLAGARVTNANLPPALLPALLAEEAFVGCRSLRRLITGGDRVPGDLGKRYAAAMAAAGNDVVPPLLARYGPTEATISVSEWPCDSAPDGQIVPLGRPIAGARLYILDRALREVPPGAPGELCVAGICLARGYLARPDLTAAAFAPLPFPRGAEEAGGRLYRTGDLARQRADGAVEFLGRIDRQVKIRGFRLELGEVEAALTRHPAVAEAVVIGRDDPGSAGKRLAAYVVARGGASLDGRRLRTFLEERLPGYMVPSAIVELPRLPLTANGKLDRQALPAPAWGPAGGSTPPRTPVEELLADLWAEVLEIDRAGLGIEDGFFDLGGHSLLATRLVSRLRQAFGVEVPLRLVFEQPALGAMARAIAGAGAAAAASLPPLSRRPAGEPAVLSFAQERIWFLDQLAPGSAAYNMPGALRLRGRLGAPERRRLARSLGEIVRRHEVLRSSYPPASDAAGTPSVVIAPAAAVPVPLVDLAALAAAEATGLRLGATLAQLSFDLATGPLLRAALLRLGPEEHLLVLVLHHIVADGWSVAIALRELSALYAALVPPGGGGLPELPLQYADFSWWQRRWLAGEGLQVQLAFWRRALAGAPGVLALPGDRSRPAEPSHRGGRVTALVPAATATELGRTARQAGATLFMTLLAAFDVLLYRVTGQEDLVVGSPIANREHLEIEPLIGCFINTLALRADLSGRPAFDSLLAKVREASLAAYAHQDLPFEKLVDALALRRDLGTTPLFQVMLVLQNTAPRLAMELVELSTATAKLDLTAAALPTVWGLALSFEYSRDLFDATTVERLLDQYLTLLGAVAAGAAGRRIADLPLLGAAQRQQLLEWNATAAPYAEDVCLHQLIEAQARRTPEAVAVEVDAAAGESGEGRESLTYAALDARAGRLARRLRRLGVGPDTVVAICAERSTALVVGLLAILKAGGAYLPLDPEYPADRLRTMLRDSGAQVLLAQERLRATVVSRLAEPASGTIWLDEPGTSWTGEPRPDRDRTADRQPRPAEFGRVLPENLAYVIYTSGSTGRPKGAMNTHRGIVNRLLWIQEKHELAADDRVLQKTPASFDVSVWELFWPLLTGACLVMARPGGHRDSAYLWQVIGEREITVVHFVPVMLAAFLDDGGPPPASSARSGQRPSPPGLRRVLASGEALSYELQQKYYGRLAAPLHNLYGPTEAAVEVTHWACPRPDVQAGPASARRVVPIGRPIANTSIHLLDREGRQVPVGVPAELYIGGVQLARGYLGRPELTAERFLPDALGEPGARQYRSGDVARWLPDGAIEYLGRADSQVKIRGFRIEPGEIEAALASHPAVRETVVVARREPPGEARLVAYVVAAHATAQEPTEQGEASESIQLAELSELLRAWLAARLPSHMVPSFFVELPALPLLPNGKCDRAALPPLGTPSRQRPDGAAAAPRTTAEATLAAIWSRVLGIERVGVRENFFALGGDSILCVQIVARAREAGLRFTVGDMFRRQTVAELAELAEGAAAAPRPAAAVEPGDGAVPLLPIQRWFFALDLVDPQHFNQAVLLTPRRRLERRILERALHQTVAHHAALGHRFERDAAGGRCRPGTLEAGGAAAGARLAAIDLAALPPAARRPAMAAAAGRLQESLDLARGPLLRAALFDAGEESRLLLILHHLIVDGISWRVLLGHLEAAYRAAAAGGTAALPAAATSCQEWARTLAREASSAATAAEAAYWLDEARTGVPRLPRDRPAAPADNTVASARAVVAELDEAATTALLREVPAAYRTRINDVLLAALLQAFGGFTGEPRLLLDLEGHGREDQLFAGVDTTVTVGWFTSLFPVLLRSPGAAPEPGELLQSVKEQLRAVPRNGLGYGLLRYLSGGGGTSGTDGGTGGDGDVAAALAAIPAPEVLFNYLGQLDRGLREDSLFAPAAEPAGSTRSPRQRRSHLLEIHGGILGGRLQLTWTYSEAVHRRATVEALADAFLTALRALIAHCRSPAAGGLTPSDFPTAGATQSDLDTLAAGLGAGALRGIERVCALSPAQQVMLGHSLAAPASGVYVVQLSLRLTGELDAAALTRSWQLLVERHEILRTGFHARGLRRPLQVVHRAAACEPAHESWRGLAPDAARARLDAYQLAERERGFDFAVPPLLRLAVIELPDGAWQLVSTLHHLLIDGWSYGILIKELFACYAAFAAGRAPDLPPARPFHDHIAWLARHEAASGAVASAGTPGRGPAEVFWRGHLDGCGASALAAACPQAPAPARSADYGRLQVVLEACETAALGDFARRHRLTVNTLVQGAWSLVLAGATGQREVLFGATTAGRPPDLPGAEAIVGPFIATLPVRVHLPGERPLATWLADLQRSQAEARGHEHAPRDLVLRWSGSPESAPLFDSVLVFENYPVDAAILGPLPDLAISDIQAHDRTHYPITLMVIPGDRLRLQLFYHARRFDEAAVASMLQGVAAQLRAFPSDPHRRLEELTAGTWRR